jgi:hypothetical protein
MTSAVPEWGSRQKEKSGHGIQRRLRLEVLLRSGNRAQRRAKKAEREQEEGMKKPKRREKPRREEG